MTLIAAFRSRSAITICADSQETITCFDEHGNPYDLRKTVQKISPLVIGKYHIAFAGAGNAHLVESFIIRASRSITVLDAIPNSENSPAGILAIRQCLENTLSSFYQHDVAICPDDDKTMKLFVAASCPISHEYALWISEYAVLRDADSPELNGWEHQMYIETARRLASHDMTLPQATLAGIYTLTIAKKTSNYIGGDLSVAIIDEDGIRMEDARYIKTMEHRLDSYESNINRIFLGCADTTVAVHELDDEIMQFKSSALELHRDHIDNQAKETSLHDLLSDVAGRRLPKGPIYISGNGNLMVEHDREKIRAEADKWKTLVLQGHAGPIKVKINCHCGHVFEATLPNYSSTLQKHTFACKACGKPNIVSNIALGDITI